MTKRWVELAVALGLMVGPLAYALTLEPEVVERVEVVEVFATPASTLEATPVVPVQPAVEVAPVEVAPAEAEPEATDDRIAFAFVTSAGIVLETEGDASWGTGRLRDHDGPGEFRAAKKVDGTRIPHELWAQRGRSFDLYGEAGKVCTVRLGDYAVLAQHDGPSLYDLVYGEDGPDYDEFDEEAVTPKQIRRAVWDRTDEVSPWLVAEIVSPSDCDGALWARDASLPAPTILHAVDEGSPVIEARLAEHAASEDLANREIEYRQFLHELDEESRGYYESWSEIVSQSPASARAWLDAEGTARLVELDFGSDDSSCGDGFDSSIRSIDRVTAEGGFEPIEGVPGPAAIFDANLDGKWELLYDDVGHGPDHLSSEAPELFDGWTIDQIWTCPC